MPPAMERNSIPSMPIAGSTYWNDVHGYTGEDVHADEEGVQTMRNLARNMCFLMRAIADGADAYGIPDRNKVIRTNFVR